MSGGGGGGASPEIDPRRPSRFGALAKHGELASSSNVVRVRVGPWSASRRPGAFVEAALCKGARRWVRTDAACALRSWTRRTRRGSRRFTARLLLWGRRGESEHDAREPARRGVRATSKPAGAKHAFPQNVGFELHDVTRSYFFILPKVRRYHTYLATPAARPLARFVPRASARLSFADPPRRRRLRPRERHERGGDEPRALERPVRRVPLPE